MPLPRHPRDLLRRPNPPSPRKLAFRRQLAEVDELHHATMREARRRFLLGVPAAGLGIAAFGPPAAAQDDVDAAVTLAESLASFEKTAAQVYQTALDADLLEAGPVLDAARLFLDHHVDHGKAFAAIADLDYDTQVSLAQDLFDQIVVQATDAGADVVAIAATLEKQAGDTYNELVGAVDATSPAGSALVGTMATIAPVEYAHWGLLAVAGGDDLLALIAGLNGFGVTSDSVAAELSQ